jgi:hypothetical protein
MRPDDVQDDPVLAALHDLGAWDVDERRAHRLRVRCRAALAGEKRGAAAPASADSARWTDFTGPALPAVWCAIYVVEIVRHEAAIYGL